MSETADRSECRPTRETLTWNEYKDSMTVHRGYGPHGSVEIRDSGESVMCGRTEKVWPILRWKAQGDGFTVTGEARSLARAKEDAGTALRLLDHCDFETATPRDEER